MKQLLEKVLTPAVFTFGLMLVVWEDREQMLADLREFKRRWISPGRADESD